MHKNKFRFASGYIYTNIATFVFYNSKTALFVGNDEQKRKNFVFF